MAIRKKPVSVRYDVSVQLYGHPAYVVDQLLKTGHWGTTKEGVVERMVSEWIIDNLGRLQQLGLSVEEARRLGYIPVKPEK